MHFNPLPPPHSPPPPPIPPQLFLFIYLFNIRVRLKTKLTEQAGGLGGGRGKGKVPSEFPDGGDGKRYLLVQFAQSPAPAQQVSPFRASGKPAGDASPSQLASPYHLPL